MKRVVLSLALLVMLSLTTGVATANVGWWVATKVAPSSGFWQNAGAGAGGAAGGYAGAKIGAALGAWGGPVCMIIGAGVGAG